MIRKNTANIDEACRKLKIWLYLTTGYCEIVLHCTHKQRRDRPVMHRSTPFVVDIFMRKASASIREKINAG